MRSITLKISSFIIITFVIIMGINSYLGYRGIKTSTTEIYGSLQQSILKSSYEIVDEKLNLLATKHLKVALKGIVQEYADFKAQERILQTLVEGNGYEGAFFYVKNKELIKYGKVSKNLKEVDVIFNESKEKAEIYLSDITKIKDKYILSIVLPFNQEGKMGLLGVDLDMGYFQTKFKSFVNPLLPHLSIFILNKEGQIISHKMPKFILDGKKDEAETYIANALKQSKEASIDYINARGLPAKASYKQLPFDWTLVVSVITTDYTEGINRAAIKDAIVGLIFLVIGVAALYGIIKIYLKPLSSIQNGLSGFFSYLNHESKNAP
ncbi:cache domain-containing protein, partial [Helicobacter burdigaliensis]